MEKKRNEWITTAEKLYKIQQHRLCSAVIEKNLRYKLRALSDSQTTSHGIFKFEKTVRKGPIDYKKIEILMGLDLEKYRKESTEVWKLNSSTEKHKALLEKLAALNTARIKY